MSNRLVNSGWFLLWVGVLLFAYQAGGGVSRPQIWVRAADHSADRFAAFLTVKRQGESLVQYLTHHMPREASRERIRNLLVIGQRDYLKDPKSARRSFESLSEEAYGDDWGRSERGAFFYAALRLSEVADSQIQRNQWLDLAIKFAGRRRNARDWTERILQRVSGRLREQFEQRKKVQDSKVFRWRPWQQFESFEYIIVNGERFVNAPNLEIPLYPGDQRLTFLGNSLAPWTGRVSSEEVSQLKVPQRLIIAGTCEQPRFITPVKEISEFGVWFDGDCTRMSQDLPLPEVLVDSPSPSAMVALSGSGSTQSVGLKRWVPVVLGVVVGAITLNHFYQQNRGTRTIVIEE